MQRIHNLDYLRGLAALGIMLYHYLTWTFHPFGADSILGRIGVYGVSIFYVLSGLTLFHVYRNRFNATDFFRKRFFRIFPLMWLAVTITILQMAVAPGFGRAILNYTGLFAIVSWDAGIGTGMWSIGNELVFYCLFPLFMLAGRKYWLVGGLLFAVYLYFSFVVLTGDLTLNKQWSYYVNPMNQAFLFFAGFAIGKVTADSNKNLLPLTAAGLAIFILYPASGDRIALVTGFARIAFTVACVLICAGLFKSSFNLHTLADRTLRNLGEISYSVYLFHGIVFEAMGFVADSFSWPQAVRFPLSVILTLVTGYFLYNYFEKPFIDMGRGNKGRPVTGALGVDTALAAKN